jgi:AraC-like DNA-binding protein
MLPFKKYLPVSSLDIQWGFVLHDIGSSIIDKGSDYPSAGHPGSHMFTWEAGRVLEEFHFVFITEGKGVFETRSTGEKNIEKGDGFLLFPGEWHRYKPLKKHGWVENWVGFTGRIPDQLIRDHFSDRSQSVIRKCVSYNLINLFEQMQKLVDLESYGFQRMASGICLQMIAEIYHSHQPYIHQNEHNALFSKFKNQMLEQLDKKPDFQLMAKESGMSYSKFRRDFKRHTGLAPLQYHLLLRIEQAKDLLVNTDMKAKEIAFKLGFESDFYFCRFFKEKTGMAPGQYRMGRQAHIS